MEVNTALVKAAFAVAYKTTHPRAFHANEGKLLGLIGATSRLFDRIKFLKTLEDGWHDGEGKRPDPEGLDWFTNKLEQWGLADSLAPYLYPTEEGGVQAEWRKDNNYITLEIDLVEQSGYLHSLHLEDDHEIEGDFRLEKESGWRFLAGMIRGLDKLTHGSQYFVATASAPTFPTGWHSYRKELPTKTESKTGTEVVGIQWPQCYGGEVVEALYESDESPVDWSSWRDVFRVREGDPYSEKGPVARFPSPHAD